MLDLLLQLFSLRRIPATPTFVRLITNQELNKKRSHCEIVAITSPN